MQRYAAKGYEPIDSDNISQTDIKFSINDQLFMEVLLVEIRGKTISYASFKTKETNKLEDNLNTEINKLGNSTNNIDFDLLDEKKELENIRKKKMEGILIRSRTKWIDEGEKSNKYFCNLENRNFISKSITKIVSHNIQPPPT